MSETLVELSIEEIEAMFPDEWILVDVTELDGGEPIRGIVIDHGLEKELLESRLNQDWDSFNCPFLFFNGPLFPEDALAYKLWLWGVKAEKTL